MSVTRTDPEGTTILDVSDPRKPKIVGRLMVPNELTHTHKVRVVGDLMVTNSEHQPGSGRRNEFKDAGFRIYDIAGSGQSPARDVCADLRQRRPPFRSSMRATPISPPRWRGLSGTLSSFTTSAIPHGRSKSRAGGCTGRMSGAASRRIRKGPSIACITPCVPATRCSGLLGLGRGDHRRLGHWPAPAP